MSAADIVFTVHHVTEELAIVKIVLRDGQTNFAMNVRYISFVNQHPYVFILQVYMIRGILFQNVSLFTYISAIEKYIYTKESKTHLSNHYRDRETKDRPGDNDLRTSEARQRTLSSRNSLPENERKVPLAEN